MVEGGGIKCPRYILMNYKPQKHLGRHVIHVYISEFHAESNGDSLIALQLIQYELGDHLQQQHHEVQQLREKNSNFSFLYNKSFILTVD